MEGPPVRALNQNTILPMDTGTGKARISVIVLRSKFASKKLKVTVLFASSSLSLDRHTKLIFMVAVSTVPNVLLVSQQA